MFNKIYAKMLKWAALKQAPYYLAALSFAESSFFPLPPDIMMIPMSLANPNRAMYFALLTTVTSVIGGIFGYFIGFMAYKTLALPLINYFHYEAQYQHIVAWFSHYGTWAVLLAGFSPIPYKLFTISAGSMQMPIIPFILASILGRGGRFLLVGGMIKKFGLKIAEVLEKRINLLGWSTVIIAIIMAGLFKLTHG